jgi:GH25 family lysozyme M1 (1,4-beta-N-acetylmuramidase)
MRDLFDNLLYYEKIYPYKFWGVILCAAVICFICVLLVWFLFKQGAINKQESALNQSILEASENDESIAAKHRNDQSVFEKKWVRYLVFLILGVCIGIIVTRLSYNTGYILNMRNENTSISNSKYPFGIDVSHYQGRINWSEVRTSHHPIEYIFIRATMGADGIDSEFKNNWLKSKQEGYIRGAYHYYRPNENSKAQFDNFAVVTSLEKGDFPPILDVEKHSKYGHENLRTGVLNWLKLAEAKYGIKPVVYTGRTFYKDVLKGYVDAYPLWIASYSGKHRLNGIDWKFHQFTEKVIVKGIKTTVDGNDFVADLEDLRNMCLKE